MDNIHTLAVEAMRAKGAADAAALAEKSVAGEADGTTLIAHEGEIPTWRQQPYNTEATPVGKPYKWQDQVYKLLQQHDATEQPDWSPDQAVSLWDICHTTDPAQAREYVAPQGSRGLWQEQECCVWSGHVFQNQVTDNAYGPAEMAKRWTDLGTVEELQGGAE